MIESLSRIIGDVGLVLCWDNTGLKVI